MLFSKLKAVLALLLMNLVASTCIGVIARQTDSPPVKERRADPKVISSRVPNAEALRAADSKPTDAQAKESLIKALEDLEKCKSLAFRGVFTEHQPEEKGKQNKDKKPRQLGPSIIAAGMNASMPRRFTGALEAWRSPEGEVVLVSVKSLPGLASLPSLGVYDNGERRIVRTHYEAESFDAGILPDELPRLLLNPPALRRDASATKNLKPVKKGDDTTYTVPLSNRVFRFNQGEGKEGLVNLLQGKIDGKPEVSRVVARIVCNGQGKVKALEFQITHLTTNAAIFRALARPGDVTINAPPGTDPKEIEKRKKEQFDKMANQEGLTTSYSLTLMGEEPSKRLRKFAEAMRKELLP